MKILCLTISWRSLFKNNDDVSQLATFSRHETGILLWISNVEHFGKVKPTYVVCTYARYLEYRYEEKVKQQREKTVNF